MQMAEERAKRTTKPVEKYSPPVPVEKPKEKKVAKEKVVKVKKAKKEKTGEKKPLVGYMLFCKHNREAAKKKVPPGIESKAQMPAVAKILGEMWGKQSESAKAEWKVNLNHIANAPQPFLCFCCICTSST